MSSPCTFPVLSCIIPLLLSTALPFHILSFLLPYPLLSPTLFPFPSSPFTSRVTYPDPSPGPSSGHFPILIFSVPYPIPWPPPLNPIPDPSSLSFACPISSEAERPYLFIPKNPANYLPQQTLTKKVKLEWSVQSPEITCDKLSPPVLVMRELFQLCESCFSYARRFSLLVTFKQIIKWLSVMTGWWGEGEESSLTGQVSRPSSSFASSSIKEMKVVIPGSSLLYIAVHWKFIIGFPCNLLTNQYCIHCVNE